MITRYVIYVVQIRISCKNVQKRSERRKCPQLIQKINKIDQEIQGSEKLKCIQNFSRRRHAVPFFGEPLQRRSRPPSPRRRTRPPSSRGLRRRPSLRASSTGSRSLPTGRAFWPAATWEWPLMCSSRWRRGSPSQL